MFNRCCGESRPNEINQNFNADQMNVDVDFNQPSMPGVGGCMAGGNMARPIIEPMQERQIHRTIVHDVPHVCPMRTKVINHHIYRHTYQPSYSCCEENTCSTVNCGSCCNFR